MTRRRQYGLMTAGLGLALWGCSDNEPTARDAAASDGGVVGVDAADTDTSALHDGSTIEEPIADALSSDAGSEAGDAAPTPALGLPYPIRWGAPQSLSQACGIAADAVGNVYVVGQTNGPLWGRAPLGRRDLFLARVRASGALEWVRQLGDAGTGLGIFAGGCAVAVGEDGEAYVAGTANGTGMFQGEPLVAVYTGFAARFDKQGERRWLRLIGESPGPTEAMAIEAHAGNVHVLGWTEAGLNGQPSRGQGDVFLVRLAATTGNVKKTLRFGSEAEDVPMGLVRDAGGLWLGLRSSRARFMQPLGHELWHLGPDDDVLDHLVGQFETGFAVVDFAVTASGDAVLMAATANEESQGYAFRVHHRDGRMGPIRAGGRAGILQARSFACGADACAVAGQQLEESATGGEEPGMFGFVHLFTPQLEPGPQTVIAGKGGSHFTAMAALTPAPAGHWYVAGWSGATVWQQPPVGSTDGLTLRLSPEGQVAGPP